MTNFLPHGYNCLSAGSLSRGNPREVRLSIMTSFSTYTKGVMHFCKQHQPVAHSADSINLLYHYYLHHSLTRLHHAWELGTTLRNMSIVIGGWCNILFDAHKQHTSLGMTHTCPRVPSSQHAAWSQGWYDKTYVCGRCICAKSPLGQPHQLWTFPRQTKPLVIFMPWLFGLQYSIYRHMCINIHIISQRLPPPQHPIR